MRKASVLLAVALSFFLLDLAPAPAHAFDCGARQVSVGDPKYEVLHKCGPPSWVDSWVEERLVRGFGQSYLDRGLRPDTRVPAVTVIYVTIEEWTYNLGPTHFIRYLRFENNRLVDIYTGDYGFN